MTEATGNKIGSEKLKINADNIKSVLTKNTFVPEGTVFAGIPAKKIKEIDLNLQRLNSYYEDLIKDGVLSTLKIKPLKRKSFINFMKSKGKLGGQKKVPRLSNDDNLINEIIKSQ